MLTDWVAEPNVLVPGVIVTTGGVFPGPQLMQMPCGLAGDGVALSGRVVVSGFAVVSVWLQVSDGRKAALTMKHIANTRERFHARTTRAATRMNRLHREGTSAFPRRNAPLARSSCFVPHLVYA
ncbi:MAG TPA: hypothetical protein VGR59_01485 [Gemmatimonadaceae bacterium]|nr:hypothetical protein [Gemmatimonadaceae bacterium]